MNRIFIYMLSLFLIFTGCHKSQEKTTTKIQIAASIMPLVDFAQQIGGEQVDVFQIIPPGTNAHTFELTPQLVKDIAGADFVILNGLGLEFWAQKLDQIIDPEKIVDTSANLDIHNLHEGHHHHGEMNEDDDDHEMHVNPHIWLDPALATRQVIMIRNALIEIDENHKSDYEIRTATLLKSLDSLSIAISDSVNTWSQKQFICFHPAWEYFAERFGLIQAAIIEPSHGMEPGPAKIAEIVETAKRIQAKAIFTEAEFPDVLSKTIARESGIVTVPLDPLGSTKGINTYIELMHYNVLQMSKALK